MSAKHDAGIVAELIDEFIKKQKIEEPEDHWDNDLIPMYESDIKEEKTINLRKIKNGRK